MGNPAEKPTRCRDYLNRLKKLLAQGYDPNDKEDEDTWSRSIAETCKALSECKGDKEVLATLCSWLDSIAAEDEESTAIQILGAISQIATDDDDTAVEVLVNCLGRHDWRYPIAAPAAKALARIGRMKSLRSLLDFIPSAFEDTDDLSAGDEAKETLRRLATRVGGDAVEPLVHALKPDRGFASQAAAAHALGELGALAAPALPDLQRLLADLDLQSWCESVPQTVSPKQFVAAVEATHAIVSIAGENEQYDLLAATLEVAVCASVVLRYRIASYPAQPRDSSQLDPWAAESVFLDDVQEKLLNFLGHLLFAVGRCRGAAPSVPFVVMSLSLQVPGPWEDPDDPAAIALGRILPDRRQHLPQLCAMMNAKGVPEDQAALDNACQAFLPMLLTERSASRKLAIAVLVLGRLAKYAPRPITEIAVEEVTIESLQELLDAPPLLGTGLEDAFDELIRVHTRWLLEALRRRST